MMKVFGKTISEYLAFQKVPLLAVIVVGLARLCLSLAGIPNSTTRWLSIDVVSLLAVFYYSVRLHTTGFGSYRHLLPINLIHSIVAQSIIIAGIVIAIVRQVDNVFSAPEFSGGRDGKTWIHAAAHLFVALIFGPIVGWILGSLVLFVARKVAPGPRQSASGAAA